MGYDEQLSAAKFRAERDLARQEAKELREELDAIKAEREYDVKALNHRIAEMEPRLMPECCEWPRYESGEPVRIGDGFSVTVHDEDGDFERTMAAESVSFDGHGAIISDSRHVVRLLIGERVKRPAVLAADNEPLEAGQTVWFVEDGDSCDVAEISRDGRVRIEYFDGSGSWHDASEFVHQRPVLDADGEPINVGDTVYLIPGEWCNKFPCWGFTSGEELEVIELNPKHEVSGSIKCRKVGGIGHCFPQPSQLTHTKPEPPDTWGLIWTSVTTGTTTLHEFERRCKALAEKENGNE